MEEYDLPALGAALIRSNAIQLESVRGTGLYGADLPVGSASRFHFGSIGKSITAVCIGILVEEGRLSWDTTLSEALPDVRMLPVYRNVTIDQVLTSRAGILPFQSDDEGDWAGYLNTGIDGQSADPLGRRRALADYSLNHDPYVEPGTRAVYSNAGWGLLGLVIDEAAGEPYESFVTRRVFVPLGMTGVQLRGWPAAADRPEQPRGHYPPEDKKPGSGQHPRSQELDDEYQMPSWLLPAGDFSGTLHDLALWAQENLRGLRGKGRLLGKDTYRLIHSVRARERLDQMYLSHTGEKGVGQFGYGFGIQNNLLGTISYAAGSGGTFYALIVVLPSLDAAFAGVTNVAIGEPLDKLVKMAAGLKRR